MSSQTEFSKKILLVKKGKKFSIKLKRKNKNYILVYKKIGKNYKLIKKSRLKSVKKHPKMKVKSHHVSKSKRNVLKKYKSHLQNGYVIVPEGLIYKQPDFDAEQIFYFKLGTKVLMSKKIFSPPHRFGTFYKVFMKKPKKIVGYISEVDVIPEYNRKVKNQLNLKYKLLEKQLNKTGRLNLESLNKVDGKNRFTYDDKPVEDRFSLSNSSSSKYYIGLSVGGRYNSRNPKFSINDLWLGLKWSGKALSGIEMDMNFNFVPSHLPIIFAKKWLNYKNLSFCHIDILAGYPLVAGYKYVIYIMGGLQLDYDYVQLNQKKIPEWTPGLVGALSFVKPIEKRFAFRMDLKIDYGFQERVTGGALAAFQIGF